jgi:gliding motility-associated-like protein
MKKLLYISFLIAGIQTVTMAQKISNKGTDFWAAFGHHLQMEVVAWFPSDSPRLVFDFSAEQAAKVVVTIDGTTYREEYNVPANSVLTSKKMPLGPNREPGTIHDPMLYTRTSNWPGGTNSEGIFKNKGIHIQSDVPITVFKRMYFSASSAATMLFPTESWGYHYQCLTSNQSFVGVGGGPNPGAFSYFYIISKQNNTKVRINPSVPNRSGKLANVPFDIILNKGEVYQFLAGQSGASAMHDVNGTTITSVSNSDGVCLPFATFVGSSATAIACTGQNANTFSLEHTFQQVFPQQAWGKRYFTVPTSVDADAFTNNFNTFRVMVKDPATVVKRNGVALTGLTRSFYEFRSNTADVIEADQPVQVAQILPSQAACNFVGRVDPDYMVLSPAEQAIKQARFMRSGLQNVDCNYLTVILPTPGLSSLKIDGQLNNHTRTYPHPSYPGFTVVIRRWDVRSNTDPRPPQQCSIESDSAFNAFTYGLGQAESYMYIAGTYINNLNGYPFIKNQYNTSDTANFVTCAKTPVELSVWLRYKPTKILWQLSKLADTISPAADVTINAPVFEETTTINNLPYYRYRLSGTYQFNRPGIFTIPVFATEPTVEQCDQTEQIPYQIEVLDTLQTDFSLLYQSCKTTETVQFEGRSKFFDSSLVKRWEWSFGNDANPSGAIGQNVSATFNAGTYNARLIAVDHIGCVADTTSSLTISDKPATPAFSFTAPNCIFSAVVFSETNPQGGVKSWFWDFGNGDTLTDFTNGYTIQHIYPKSGTYTVKHVAKFGDNCISDTATQTITIFANPALGITYPQGCLPGDGVLSFTSTVTTPENQDVLVYLWNFGDPNADVSNPNISQVANPSHKYDGGNYNVSLRVVTANGCLTDSVWSISLFAKPQIQYGPVLLPVCLNTPSPVSVASATVTNGVTGKGFYRGPGTDSSGNFNAAVAGVGNQAIRYLFTTEKGCTDSASATIWVHAVPVAAFTATETACLNQAITFTNQSTIDQSVDAGAQISTWTWNFGDGSPDSVVNNGQPFNRLFSSAGAYSVTLTAKTADGCNSNTVSKTITVNPVPLASFSLPTGVCMPGGSALFTNASVLAGQGQMVYEWNFGDGGTSTQVNPTHVYTSVNAFTVTLKASSALGCTDDTTIVLPVTTFVNKPIAGFDISITRPCVGTIVNFTDKSTSSGNISTWGWIFGDATTSTQQNPSKTLSSHGNFTAGLVVTDNSGCVSDTVYKSLLSYANPVVAMSYPVGCLPENGEVQFTSSVSTPDNQAVQSYLWNFGDPNAGGSNPNTSTQANPTHRYVAGNYAVGLKVTTVNGCTTDSVWNISLFPRPEIQYGPILTPVCLNTPAPVSVATARVTNGALGTGIYTGKGTGSQGNFDPNVAGVGNHTIWYVFTTQNGCRDSAAATIWVHAVPNALFDAPASICLNETATFTNQSTINTSVDANASIATWTWNFDDGSGNVVKTDGLSFTRNFAAAKAYNVTLITTSADGCTGNTFSKTLNVNAIPVADFSIPSGICMPGGQATFTNRSTVGGQATLTYQWNFGDGSTSTQVSPSHIYTNVQPYNVSLTATSSFGCRADTSILLPAAAFVQRPVPAFDMSTDKACEGTAVSFTDRSTSGSGITGWNWSFGDGTTSTQQNPSKTFTRFGTYTVSLQVTDQNGCAALPLSISKSVQININPKIDAGPDLAGEENSTVILKATAANASELVFSWQPAGLLNNPDILQPSYIVKADQVFILTATDKDGICSATDEMKVTVLRGITAPNAFSPNGDGINDVWFIRNLTDYPDASVKIFDRYGRQVFVSKGYSTPWDGKLNGTPVPAGTYYYIIHVKQGENPITGSVTLLR